MWIILILLSYFSLLLLISHWAGKRNDNKTFFSGNRKSPWYLVAFGMLGASISGVSFISVPGMILGQNMGYLQMCLGFIVGYLLVAFILLPIYYKLNLTTIYTYLKVRMGQNSYKTGASFFLLSKMCGAAVRFYAACMVLHRFAFDAYGVPFSITAIVMIFLIWLYTRKGGIRTLVFTDVLQTLLMYLALVVIFFQVVTTLDLSISDAFHHIQNSSYSQVFVWDDLWSKNYFWKQFLSGVFIVIVMTGLDQDMMQKNLTCKNLSDAQKDMCVYGVAFFPTNLLFLSLGVLLVMFFQKMGLVLPTQSDDLILTPIAGGMLNTTTLVLFMIGILAACFSSADSALTSMTTTFCVDICERPADELLRKGVHLGICVLFVLFIISFNTLGSKSLIDTVYTISSYTYGPLLGLFSFGLFTKRQIRESWVPLIALSSPLMSYAIDRVANYSFGYQFGYELLLLNGMLSFLGFMLCSQAIKKAY